jgi:hypothetical protein
MRQFDEQDSKGWGGSLRSGLAMLAFGLTILTYLVSIDHPEWFHMRPASGTAVAMANAATHNADNTTEARQESNVKK